MRNKNKLKYAAFAGCLTLSSVLTSCTDWLTLYPMDKIVEENFWEDKKDLESVRNAAYKNMISDACMERYIVWGELRADNFIKSPGANPSADIQDILNVNLKPSNGYYNWADFYATINYCNKVIEHGPEILQKDLSFSQGDWESIRAEMYALRALNYFYLIRTFENVPLVMKAINDDTEVKAMPAAPQKEVLDTLVNQLEYICTTNMPTRYGNSSDNCGLITDKAIHALLADIYLWRASSLEFTDKGAADLDYQKCIEHCNEVIRIKDEEYKKDQSHGMGGGLFPGSGNDKDNPYHLLRFEGDDVSGLMMSAYDEIFGSKNSYESLFELQFNGDANPNNMIQNWFRKFDKIGIFIASDQMLNPAATPDAADNFYYKTDLRRFATLEKFEEGKMAYIKYAAEEVDQKSLYDNTVTDNAKQPVYTLRTQAEANWIFYRLTEVLLMKAEALCRLNTEASRKEAFALVEQVYMRSNIKAIAEGDKLPAERASSMDALEGLILRERNRELAGEGKRWFDMVRYAMRKGPDAGASAAFEIFGKVFSGSTQSSARNKYRQSIEVMYSPYAESEIKANPELVQNPIWDDQSTIEKN